MVVPIYIGEIASKEIRGTVGSFFQQMINLGIVATYALGLILDVFWLSIACGVVPIVYGILFFFMPNTPTYLVSFVAGLFQILTFGLRRIIAKFGPYKLIR